MRRTPKNRTVGRLLWLLILRLVRRQQRNAVHMARIKTATYYVKGVQAARLSLMAYLGLCMLRFTLGFGFVLLHAGLLVYLPWSAKQKGLLLMGLGGFYAVAGMIVFAALLSQRTWMKATRADEAVARAVRNRPLHNETDPQEIS